jgi:hypothetical protein
MLTIDATQMPRDMTFQVPNSPAHRHQENPDTDHCSPYYIWDLAPQSKLPRLPIPDRSDSNKPSIGSQRSYTQSSSIVSNTELRSHTTLQNGDFYNGQLVNDLPHGLGILKSVHQGTSYRGQFVNGLKSGEGELEYKNGRKDTGVF